MSLHIGRVFYSLGSPAVPPAEIEEALDLVCLFIDETRRHLAPRVLDEVKLTVHKESPRDILLTTTWARLDNKSSMKPWLLPNAWLSRLEDLCQRACQNHAFTEPFFYECYDPCPPMSAHRRLALRQAHPDIGPACTEGNRPDFLCA